MQMRSTSLPFILLGPMFTAGGYGGTFLISAWFHAQGGSDIDTGKALSLALVGTLLGVPLVGWCAGKIDAARLAAVASLVLAGGYALLANLHGIDPDYLPRLATLLMGLGWGMFYLATLATDGGVAGVPDCGVDLSAGAGNPSRIPDCSRDVDWCRLWSALSGDSDLGG